MENIKKKFGFGCMRLPTLDNSIDFETFTKMVDIFIKEGFNYFDTAHVYHGGNSELALKKCLTSRYKREQYILTNKLSSTNFNSKEDIRPLFESQLQACGVEYFDYYLMHSQSEKVFEKYKKCHAYETAFELKKEGKIKHVGLSFHDKAEVLEKILKEYPEIEVVQIQFNYVDYDDASIEGRKCYEVCVKYNKPVIVMEPVKGGLLVNLPDSALDVLSALNNGSPASYAIRFAASFDNIIMVLSGMSTLDQVIENTSFMKEFKPLNDEEFKAIDKVCEILKSSNIIPCTACSYCVDGCPKNIKIPALFACLNSKKQYNNWNSNYYYSIHTQTSGKASDCIKCGKCELICPQHLKIRDLLVEVASTFEKQED